ncbi:transcriptional regulator family: Fungal Specific TF [Aspergillus niger]|nr:transcriptional regulator family: Fungal Specific TF [Aspergillus niger]
MGGIAYQSQGCANCRHRRIKCDLAKPECARCVKRGTLCLGYETSRHFLHHTVVTRIDKSGASSKRPVTQRLGQLRPLALPAAMNLGADMRTQLFSTFMNTFFAPSINTRDLNARDDSWYFLMARFPSLAGESALLDRSVMALVCTYLGKNANDGPLARNGIALYSDALRLMAGQLSQKRPPTPHLLYATIVFHTYEVMQPGYTALHNCLAHIRGATAIINHPFFEDSSEDILTQTMVTRQKWAAAFRITMTPSTSDEFDYKCLMQRPSTSPLGAMFAILAEAACLQRRLDALSSQPRPDRPEAAQRLLQCFFDLAERLRATWPDERSDCSLPADQSLPYSDTLALPYEPEVLPQSAHNVNSSPYNFSDLATGKTYLLYWIVGMTICKMVNRTGKLLLEGNDGATAAPMLLRVPVREIHRALAYHLHPRNINSSAHVVLFAVSLLSRFYIESLDDIGFWWCQDIYRLLHRRGLEMASRLSETDRRLWAGI